MQDFLQLAGERYSVRKYSDKEIEDEKLDKILRAGQIGPTANNSQPQRVFVIKSKEALEKIRSFTPYSFNAPIVLMICYDENVSGNARDGHDYGADDATIATTQMMLEAWDLGIGSVWVRGYDKHELEKLFDLPENMVSVALLPIGYPSENSKPSPLHSRNIDIDDMVRYL
ncbi:nitroreductase family protein [Methanobrevibacter sp.]|uniref:nitroreductase family protein n=1 Tax=Methanobrevibacter sp. TaxID=66852 RepID=UPI00388F7F75